MAGVGLGPGQGASRLAWALVLLAVSAAGCGGAAVPGSRQSASPGTVPVSSQPPPGLPIGGTPAPGLPASPAPTSAAMPASASRGALSPSGLPEPTLASLSPSSGPPGSVLHLKGFHLGRVAGRVALAPQAGGPAVRLSVTRWTDGEVDAVVPDGLPAGVYVPQVWDAEGRSAGPAGPGAWPVFVVLGPSPVVTQISPGFAPAGSLVEIRGQNFGSQPGRVVFVQFWGTPSASYADAPVISWSSSEVVVRSPGGQNGVARIRLTTAAGQGVWAGSVTTGGGPATPSGAFG